MVEKALKEIGQEFVKMLRDEFDKKKLNDTKAGRDSITYKVEQNKLMIEGLARVLFLEYGRMAGKFPNVDAIRGWVERKLNIPPEEVDNVAYLIGRKIAKHGTDILTDKTKGLQIELLLDQLNDELSKMIINFEQLKITNGLITTWQSQK